MAGRPRSSKRSRFPLTVSLPAGRRAEFPASPPGVGTSHNPRRPWPTGRSSRFLIKYLGGASVVQHYVGLGLLSDAPTYLLARSALLGQALNAHCSAT